WVDHRLATLNTASTESYNAVLRWGAPSERVRCYGLPVNERFGEVEASPDTLRLSYGLEPNRFTAMLVGGGEGAGGLEAIVRKIDKANLPIQIIVVCGRNDALRARLESAQLRTPAHICGFVRTMPEIMHASDAIIT